MGVGRFVQFFKTNALTAQEIYRRGCLSGPRFNITMVFKNNSRNHVSRWGAADAESKVFYAGNSGFLCWEFRFSMLGIQVFYAGNSEHQTISLLTWNRSEYSFACLIYCSEYCSCGCGSFNFTLHAPTHPSPSNIP